MNHSNHSKQLTDQLERQLIQQEIGRQMSFAPMFNFKRITDKIAAAFGYVRIEASLGSPRTAH